ncbi:hypothetical protein OG453_44620 [Streptomyces sp. NBC_01381]|uniref:hypothetical protein n=1 Tax=Streptomyces sp. NBC_01381 TaxID=2903845 RepID=UPI0022547481|nr:hypothetical protein [Streptomyces sp. NBC_01381]MCX4673644.1 hypothetical protein [Streptomyces sp. NBC_01381]
MNDSRFSRTIARARSHWELVRSRCTDAGYSVTEWVYITAGGVTVGGLIYAAIQTKALEKIGIINGG